MSLSKKSTLQKTRNYFETIEGMIQQRRDEIKHFLMRGAQSVNASISLLVLNVYLANIKHHKEKLAQWEKPFEGDTPEQQARVYEKVGHYLFQAKNALARLIPPIVRQQLGYGPNQVFFQRLAAQLDKIDRLITDGGFRVPARLKSWNDYLLLQLIGYSQVVTLVKKFKGQQNESHLIQSLQPVIAATAIEAAPLRITRTTANAEFLSAEGAVPYIPDTLLSQYENFKVRHKVIPWSCADIEKGLAVTPVNPFQP